MDYVSRIGRELHFYPLDWRWNICIGVCEVFLKISTYYDKILRSIQEIMASNVNFFSLVSINIWVANFLNVLCNISIILKGRSKGTLMGSRVLEPRVRL